MLIVIMTHKLVIILLVLIVISTTATEDVQIRSQVISNNNNQQSVNLDNDNFKPGPTDLKAKDLEQRKLLLNKNRLHNFAKNLSAKLRLCKICTPSGRNIELEHSIQEVPADEATPLKKENNNDIINFEVNGPLEQYYKNSQHSLNNSNNTENEDKNKGKLISDDLKQIEVTENNDESDTLKKKQKRDVIRRERFAIDVEIPEDYYDKYYRKQGGYGIRYSGGNRQLSSSKKSGLFNGHNNQYKYSTLNERPSYYGNTNKYGTHNGGFNFKFNSGNSRSRSEYYNDDKKFKYNGKNKFDEDYENESVLNKDEIESEYRSRDKHNKYNTRNHNIDDDDEYLNDRKTQLLNRKKLEYIKKYGYDNIDEEFDDDNDRFTDYNDEYFDEEKFSGKHRTKELFKEKQGYQGRDESNKNKNNVKNSENTDEEEYIDTISSKGRYNKGNEDYDIDYDLDRKGQYAGELDLDNEENELLARKNGNNFKGGSTFNKWYSSVGQRKFRGKNRFNQRHNLYHNLNNKYSDDDSYRNNDDEKYAIDSNNQDEYDESIFDKEGRVLKSRNKQNKVKKGYRNQGFSRNKNEYEDDEFSDQNNYSLLNYIRKLKNRLRNRGSNKNKFNAKLGYDDDEFTGVDVGLNSENDFSNIKVGKYGKNRFGAEFELNGNTGSFDSNRRQSGLTGRNNYYNTQLSQNGFGKSNSELDENRRLVSSKFRYGNEFGRNGYNTKIGRNGIGQIDSNFKLNRNSQNNIRELESHSQLNTNRGSYQSKIGNHGIGRHFGSTIGLNADNKFRNPNIGIQDRVEQNGFGEFESNLEIGQNGVDNIDSNLQFNKNRHNSIREQESYGQSNTNRGSYQSKIGNHGIGQHFGPTIGLNAENKFRNPNIRIEDRVEQNGFGEFESNLEIGKYGRDGQSSANIGLHGNNKFASDIEINSSQNTKIGQKDGGRFDSNLKLGASTSFDSTLRQNVHNSNKFLNDIGINSLQSTNSKQKDDGRYDSNVELGASTSFGSTLRQNVHNSNQFENDNIGPQRTKGQYTSSNEQQEVDKLDYRSRNNQNVQDYNSQLNQYDRKGFDESSNVHDINSLRNTNSQRNGINGHFSINGRQSEETIGSNFGQNENRNYIRTNSRTSHGDNNNELNEFDQFKGSRIGSSGANGLSNVYAGHRGIGEFNSNVEINRNSGAVANKFGQYGIARSNGANVELSQGQQFAASEQSKYFNTKHVGKENGEFNFKLNENNGYINSEFKQLGVGASTDINTELYGINNLRNIDGQNEDIGSLNTKLGEKGLNGIVPSNSYIQKNQLGINGGVSIEFDNHNRLLQSGGLSSKNEYIDTNTGYRNSELKFDVTSNVRKNPCFIPACLRKNPCLHGLS